MTRNRDDCWVLSAEYVEEEKRVRHASSLRTERSLVSTEDWEC